MDNAVKLLVIEAMRNTELVSTVALLGTSRSPSAATCRSLPSTITPYAMPGTRAFVAKARMTLSICGNAARNFATRSGSVKRAGGATLDCARAGTAAVASKAAAAMANSVKISE